MLKHQQQKKNPQNLDFWNYLCISHLSITHPLTLDYDIMEIFLKNFLYNDILEFVAATFEPVYWHNVQSVHQWSGRQGFNPRASHTKNSKEWYLMPPCLTLSLIRYGSKVRGAIQGKE